MPGAAAEGEARGRTRLDVAARADRQAGDVHRLLGLEVEEGRARRGEHDGRRLDAVLCRHAGEFALHLLRARHVARIEVLEDLGLLAVRVDRLGLTFVPLELIGLAVEQRLARIAPLGRRELHKELLVALDDDGEAVVAEAEGLLRLEGNDVDDRDDHLGEQRSGDDQRGSGRGARTRGRHAPVSW